MSDLVLREASDVEAATIVVRIALQRQRVYYERLGYRLVEYCTHDGYEQPTYVILEKEVDSVD